jgi:hypothetical protein
VIERFVRGPTPGDTTCNRGDHDRREDQGEEHAGDAERSAITLEAAERIRLAVVGRGLPAVTRTAGRGGRVRQIVHGR